MASDPITSWQIDGETMETVADFVFWGSKIIFLVVMYGCESSTIKKAECRIIDAFELWCWRRLLRGPWTARRSNRKGRRTREQIADIRWIIKKARKFQRNIYFCFIGYAKAFDCVNHSKLENFSRDGNARPPDLPPEKSAYRSKSNS